MLTVAPTNGIFLMILKNCFFTLDVRPRKHEQWANCGENVTWNDSKELFYKIPACQCLRLSKQSLILDVESIEVWHVKLNKWEFFLSFSASSETIVSGWWHNE